MANNTQITPEFLQFIVKLLSAKPDGRKANYYNAANLLEPDEEDDESLADRDVTRRRRGYKREEMSVIPPARMEDFHRDKGYIENWSEDMRGPKGRKQRLQKNLYI